MKLEIDTGNIKQLEELERDFSVALETIRHAITAIKARGQTNLDLGPTEPARSNGEAVALEGRPSEVLRSLPTEFTTPQWVERNHAIGLSRAAALKLLYSARSAGLVHITQEGKGRRATKYQKTQ